MRRPGVRSRMERQGRGAPRRGARQVRRELAGDAPRSRHDPRNSRGRSQAISRSARRRRPQPSPRLRACETPSAGTAVISRRRCTRWRGCARCSRSTSNRARGTEGVDRRRRAPCPAHDGVDRLAPRRRVSSAAASTRPTTTTETRSCSSTTRTTGRVTGRDLGVGARVRCRFGDGWIGGLEVCRAPRRGPDGALPRPPDRRRVCAPRAFRATRPRAHRRRLGAARRDGPVVALLNEFRLTPVRATWSRASDRRAA